MKFKNMIHQILAIMKKDIVQWTRRPMYFMASILLGILIIAVVGNTIAGATHMPFGLYDPSHISSLSKHLDQTSRFQVINYNNFDIAKEDLAHHKIVALAYVNQNLLEDTVEIITEGHNPLIDDQISMGLLAVLTQKSSDLSLPIKSASLFPGNFTLRDFVTPGLAAYMCYVLASMNIGFSWIYEWTDKTYRQIILVPNGLKSVLIAKSLTVTFEASVILWLSLCITSLLCGFTLGNNFWGIIFVTIISMLCFSSIGLTFACMLKTIRVYTMTVTILGVSLMFVSGIIIPVEATSRSEQLAAKFLPMYYSSEAFKGVMLNVPVNFTYDIIVLLIWAVLSMSIAYMLLNKKQAVL